MRLSISNGTGVVSACPYHTSNIWKCIHCKPETAACARACERGAIIEVAEGVLTIDRERCDGCGKCVTACPQGAIRIVRGKAIKCDLCAGTYEEPACVGAGFARILYSRKEIDEIGRALGWTVLETGEYRIDIDPPRLWEARLAREVIRRYEKLRGHFSWEDVLEGISYELGEIPARIKKRVVWWLNITLELGGPLHFLDREEIEEIAVNGLKSNIWVYIRGKGWLKTNVAFWTEEYFVSVANMLAATVGRRLTLSEGRVTAVLPNGSRLHVIIPPLSITGHTMTIRRFKRAPMTPYDLITNETATLEQMALIWLFIDAEKNIIISGNTGSGKTTTLNAISAFFTPEERIIVVEETPELRLPHEHVVRLLPNESVSMQELVYDTLRMRPDRVIVGEVRRPEEMRALFDTMLAGQGRGSYATMHGRSVEETLKRIESMGIPREDIITLDLVVVQKRRRLKKGVEERKIREMGIGRTAVSYETLAEVLEMSKSALSRELEKRENALLKIRERSLKSYMEAVERWRKSL